MKFTLQQLEVSGLKFTFFCRFDSYNQLGNISMCSTLCMICSTCNQVCVVQYFMQYF